MVVTPTVVPPVTNPVAEPMVAIVLFVLLHVPPVDASLKVVVWPKHKPETPVMAGTELTVTAAVIKHPVGNV